MSVSGNGFTDRSFTFLADLAVNNDTEWFHGHRDDYLRYVDEPFTDLLDDVTQRLQGTAAPLRGGPGTTFRLNRDVRFSADKSPYNTTRSGLLTRDGTKAESSGLVYVQMGATGGFVAGGLYKPQTARLDPLRQAMIEDPEAWSDTVAALEVNGLELDRADAVKTMPRGYAAYADDPRADDLRLRQLVVMQTLPRTSWLDDTVAERIAQFAVGVAPLLAFIGSPPRR